MESYYYHLFDLLPSPRICKTRISGNNCSYLTVRVSNSLLKYKQIINTINNGKLAEILSN